MMTTTVMSTMTTCNPCDYETAKCERLLFRKGLIVLFMNEYLWKEFFQFFSDDSNWNVILFMRNFILAPWMLHVELSGM